MEVFLIKTLQLLLCFCILIVLHEGGHFFFAKLFKVRVEKFCLFFDPKWSLKLFHWKGTDYHIGWIPLGGYVKISGMIDESMDTEQMKQPVKDYEFRAKPAWQRFFIMAGGVLVNFLLALFIYAMILFTWGDTYTPMKNYTNGFKYNETAMQLGFRDGDIPVRTDRGELDRFNGDVYREISLAKEVTVLREGKEVTVNLPGDLNLLDMLKSNPPFMDVLAPALIDSVDNKLPAQQAGIKAGDKVLSLNGKEMTTWNEFNFMMNDITTSIKAYREEGNNLMADSLSRVSLVVRHADNVCDTISMTLTKDARMGIYKHLPVNDYKQVTREYGFLESFPAGVAHGWNVLCGYVSDLRYIFTAEGANSIGSFGTIGNLFPTEWDWMKFWNLTAFISLMLAFVNILPIPALDGGHILFLLFEIVTRRKPSEKFMERAQMAGMCLLLALMAFAIFNDIRHFLF